MLGAAPGWVAPILDSGEGDLFGLLLVGFGGGLFFVGHGFLLWRRKRLMQDTPRETVRAIAIGRTELYGTAHPIDGAVPRPFHDGECVVAKYEIEEYRSDDDGGNWHTLEEGTVGTPFHLDDGTGRVRVEPPVEEGTFDISEAFYDRFEVDSGDSPPDPVRTFLATHPDVGPGGSGFLDWFQNGDRRYTEYWIPPGEDVYVLGGATERADADETAGASNSERLVIRTDEASGEFIMSDQSEDQLLSEYRWRAPAEMVGGLVLAAVCLYLLLTLFPLFF